MQPRLNIAAENPTDLLSRLSAVDITVPLRTEGRTSSHCERYTASRLLSTLAGTLELNFPLQLVHREKPDFELVMPDRTVGIECTEAVSDEWAQIDAIRERDYPDSLIMLPMLKPGAKKFTIDERIAIAKGAKAGPPWVGNMAERQWAEAQAHFISEKTKKLRAGNYAEFNETWLLIQDEWRVPVYRLEEREEAAKLCVSLIQPLLAQPCFSRIYICNSSWLVRLAPSPVAITGIRDLWN